MTDHKHNWQVKSFGWRTEDFKSIYSETPRTGAKIFAHNRYLCIGCNTYAIGHPDMQLWNEKTGEEIKP
jgi:hypothetical protein